MEFKVGDEVFNLTVNNILDDYLGLPNIPEIQYLRIHLIHVNSEGENIYELYDPYAKDINKVINYIYATCDSIFKTKEDAELKREKLILLNL